MIKLVCAITFFFLSFQSLAASIEQQLISCSQIAKASIRLTCFDAIASTIEVNDINASSSGSKPLVNQPTPAKKTQAFGFEVKEMAKTPEKIVATIESLTKNPYGYYNTISLKNGQVWQQKESKNFRLTKGEVVYIKKGALGSFLLGKEGQNKKIRVKRIK